jgi:hypothetical protein
MKTLLYALILSSLLAACAGGAASSPAATGVPSPSPIGQGAVTSAEEAVARVAEINPALVGIGPENPDMIGACCFWRAEETAEGYLVEFEVGWGDCPAGCIDRHQWTYAVGSDGSVELVSEQGPPVPAGVPGEPAG